MLFIKALILLTLKPQWSNLPHIETGVHNSHGEPAVCCRCGGCRMMGLLGRPAGGPSGLSKTAMEEAARMRAILEESGILVQEPQQSPRREPAPLHTWTAHVDCIRGLHAWTAPPAGGVCMFKHAVVERVVCMLRPRPGAPASRQIWD